MNNERIYTEMCSFLSDKEEMLTDFKKFYNNNKDLPNFTELFDNEYGAMYDSFGGGVKYNTSAKPKVVTYQRSGTMPHSNSTTPDYQQQISNDISIIRKWVQFFGLIVIISISLSIVSALIFLSDTF